MSKPFYEMLDIAPDAPLEEIKRAFRREIAKYHPDKVQHLGKEFQDIAAVKAAELTHAYKTLTDEASRAQYDADLDGGVVQQERPAPPAPPAGVANPTPADAEMRRPVEERPPPTEPPAGSFASVFAEQRAGASDLVRRATVMRFRRALETEFGQFEEITLPGFEVTCVPKSAFWGLKPLPRVLGRFVSQVDAGALTETWTLAVRLKSDGQRDLCVFVMGPALAPARELAAAIAEQRRRAAPAGGKVVIVPVNTMTWAAHVPTDAPPVVKSLLTRLKTA